MNIADLKPDTKNARRHNPRNIGMIASALQEVGAARSIVIDEDNNILAGNGTIEAAAQVGIDRIKVVETDGNEIVAVRRNGLSKRDKKRLALYDNRTAELADWEPQILADDKDILDGLFNTQELNDILAGLEVEQKEDPGAQLDRAAELQVKWQTERGQLWSIGKHRLLCGDSTNGDDVARLMGGQKAQAVVTDPPYGVGKDYGEFEDTAHNVAELVSKIMPTLLEYPVVAMTPGIPALWSYPAPSWLLAWVHPAPVGSCPWGFGGLNPILVYGKDPYLAAKKGRRPDSLVLAADREGVEGHPTPKPIKVWTWLVERICPLEGTIVFDPFLGSGTTMVAAEQTGRICYGMEIEPKYCAVTLERMAGMGLTPRLLSNTSNDDAAS